MQRFPILQFKKHFSENLLATLYLHCSVHWDVCTDKFALLYFEEVQSDLELSQESEETLSGVAIAGSGIASNLFE